MEIIMSQDGLQAKLKFTHKDSGVVPVREDVENLLAESGVKYGISLNGWVEAYEQFRVGRLEDNSVIIARGTPPTPGENGRVEYLFNTNPSMSPKVLPDDRVDFFSLEVLENVSKGQPLAHLHPPVPGKPGVKVTGESIAPPEVQETRFQIGKNVTRAADDPNTLVAVIDGHVRLVKGHEVVVDDVFTVRDNVDFSVGNINSVGSVVIHGDVKSGFSVEAKGNVIVRGTVEDARIVAGGDVIVKKGFIGHGKGSIQAGGSVTLKHIDNQNVSAEKDVVISEEVVQSRVVAGHSIVVRSKKGNVIGGSLSAGTEIIAQNIGNEHFVRTEVCVGGNPKMEGECEKAQDDLKGLCENLERIKKGIFNLVRYKVDQGGTLPKDKEKMLSDLMNTRDVYDAKKTAIEIHIKTLKEQLSMLHQTIKIAVPGNVYPGVIFRYHNRAIAIDKHTKNLSLTVENF